MSSDNVTALLCVAMIAAGMSFVAHNCNESSKANARTAAVEELYKTRRLRIDSDLRRAQAEARARTLAECMRRGSCLVFEVVAEPKP